jgi:hypothetical protein
MGMSAEFWVTVLVQIMTAAFIVGTWRAQQRQLVARVERVELNKVEKEVYERDLNELKVSDLRLEKGIDTLQTVVRLRR